MHELINLRCAGTSISFNNFEALFRAAGGNSRISLTDSHWQPPSNLHGLMRSAGGKKLTIDAPGNFLSVSQMSSLIASAAGSETELEVGSINNYSTSDVVEVVKLLAGKNYSLEVSCQMINEANVGPLMDALRNASGSISFESANMLSSALLAVVLTNIAGKAASFVLDSKLSSPERTMEAISQISTSGFASSLTDPPIYSASAATCSPFSSGRPAFRCLSGPGVFSRTYSEKPSGVSGSADDYSSK